MSDIDEQFDEIIQNAISKGNVITCPLPEFLVQMHSWISEICVVIEAAKRDLAAQAEEVEL